MCQERLGLGRNHGKQRSPGTREPGVSELNGMQALQRGRREPGPAEQEKARLGRRFSHLEGFRKTAAAINLEKHSPFLWR